MNKYLTSAMASALLLSVSMPASALAQDERAQGEIIVMAKHQKQWDKGNKLEAQGLKEMEKAKTSLINSSSDVVKAQNKRDTARAQAERSSAEFRNLISNNTYFSDAVAAAKWAKDVEKAASDWAKYDNRRYDGREDLDKASKYQIKNQSAVDKAQSKIDTGRALKAEAERLSQLSSLR